MPSTHPIQRATGDWVVRASTSIGTSSTIWTSWTESYTASTSTSTSDTWRIWVNGHIQSAYSTSTTGSTIITAVSDTASPWYRWSDNYRISNEECRRRTARTAQQQEERIRAEGERKEARERAAQLLQEHLNIEQQAELADKGYFHLQSIDRNGQRRKYRIRRGYQQNIHEVDEGGRILNTICAHPQMRVPDEDAMLIQKLMLESPEGHADFMRIANVSNRR